MLGNSCFTSMLLLIRGRHKIRSHSAHTTIDGDTHIIFAEGFHIVSEANTASDRTEITSEEEHRWRAIPRSILLDGMYFDPQDKFFSFQYHYC